MKAENQDKHCDADKWLEAHRCLCFEPGRKPRPSESGTGKVCVRRRLQGRSPAL